MIRLEYSLDVLPFEELLEDVQLLLHHDRKELERQTNYFNSLLKAGKKTEDYLTRFKERLHHEQNRYEFFNQLLCRCQTYHFRCIAMALEQAEMEAKKRGSAKEYGLLLFINEGIIPEILII